MSTPKKPSNPLPGKGPRPSNSHSSERYSSARRPADLHNSRTDRQSAYARKRKISQKSRHYRKRQRKLVLLFSVAGAVLLLLFIAFLVRLFGSSHTTKVPEGDSSKAVSMVVSEENQAANPSAPAKEETPAPAPPVTLTVSLAGDCTLGTDEYFDYSTSVNAYFENYGPEYFLKNVKSIFDSDDLTILNNEGTFTTSTERKDTQFAFKGDADFAKIYSSSSVEAVNTANNHSHDYGEQGFADTMAALDAEGIVHFGYDETAIMDIKGVKVGLVGIYEIMERMECAPQLKANIAKVKEDGAQLVIVVFHWGNEKETVPDEDQMSLARMAIDEGADLVCGHHAHVIQGIENYKGKNIVYGLANFCFGGNSYPSDMDTYIFQQTFTIDENGVKEDNVTNVIPCSVSSDYGYNNYQPTPATGEEKIRIQSKIEERSSWIPKASQAGS